MPYESRCPNCGQLVAPSRLETNPFAAPQSQAWAAPERADESGDRIDSPGIAEALGATRPWVLFLGVLGFIGGGLVLVAAAFMFFAGLAGPRQPGPPLVMMAGIYLVMGLVQLAAAYHIFAYGQRIGDFLASRHVHPLTEALRAQKSFWRLIGIAALLYLVILALSVGGMIVFFILKSSSV